ncbi:MAG: exopolysaccharide biosynthesis protein, partial [Jannaschia sp.]
MTQPSEVLDALSDATADTDRVSVDRIMDHLGHRSMGALLALPAALEITPVGGIPGVPTVLAAIVALVAVQMLLGRDDLWLPDVLGRRAVTADRMRAAIHRLRPVARWADRHLGT